MTTSRVAAATVVAVMSVYDVLLLGPATAWLKANAFLDFGASLPAPTQFLVDEHWELLVAVLVTHGAAVLARSRRLGLFACFSCMFFSAGLTAFWVYAMYLPFFSIAGAIK